MVDWGTEHVRVTCFPSEPLQNLSVDWWNIAVGAVPDTQEIRQRDLVAVYRGPVTANGLTNAALQLQVQPQRVEWRVLLENPFNDRAGTIGTFSDAVQALRSLVLPHLAKTPRLVRFAFGTTLRAPAETYAAAIQQVSDRLPFDPRADSARDFTYRVNRRKESIAVPGIIVNRLQSWSAITMNTVTLPLGPGGLTKGSTEESWTASQLVLDINTVPNGDQVLDDATLPALFEEFVALANELAEHGDAAAKEGS